MKRSIVPFDANTAVLNDGYLSDYEVALKMREPLGALSLNAIARVEREAEKPAHKKKSQFNVDKEHDDQSQILSEEERSYLISVFKHPLYAVRDHREGEGLSIFKADKIKKGLMETGLIEEVAVNLGQQTGGIIKFLELTEKGYAVLGKKPPHRRPLNISAEHFFWQKHIHGFYCSQGYDAVIEMNLNGKSADVGFRAKGGPVAVEVELSPANAVRNVQADLEAGFVRIIVACKNAKVRNVVRERFARALTFNELSHVKRMLLPEFSFVADILGKGRHDKRGTKAKDRNGVSPVRR